MRLDGFAPIACRQARPRRTAGAAPERRPGRHGGADGADVGAGNAVAAGGPLRVASYNVQFVTPDLPLLGHVLREWPGHKPNVAERAEAIAERLACFDIVALQETINDQRRREILDRLETRGPRLRQALAPAVGPDVRVRPRARTSSKGPGCRWSATS